MNEHKKEYSFTEQKVRWVKKHTPKLLSFSITRPKDFDFIAGQFAKLGFMQGDEYISRAYSMISAENADHLDFYAILIEGGIMSGHFNQMQAGDSLLLEKKPIGFFTVSRIPQGKELVLLATGSGIAPFLSILQQPAVWERFDTLALAHSVSFARDLIFNDWIRGLSEHPLIAEHIGKLRFVPITTRETAEGALSCRLPELLKNGRVAQAFQRPFTPADSRFMICGNPQMVQDVFKTLLEMGFAMHRNKLPGQIMMENGF